MNVDSWLGVLRTFPLTQKTTITVSLLASAFAGLANPAELSLDALMQGPRVQDAAISPDGRYVSLVTVTAGRSIVLIYDRQSQSPARLVLAETPDGTMRPVWCAWGNATRVVCGYRGLKSWGGGWEVTSNITRLVAIDADGGNLQILMNRGNGAGLVQDRVIDWTPDDPRTVLIQYQESLGDLPAVFALDIYTAERAIHTGPRPSIRRFVSDQHGNVRLGWSASDTAVRYFGRLNGKRDWKSLGRAELFAENMAFEPISIIYGTNFAYATRDKDGFGALWKIDLEDQVDPELVYAHAPYDIDGPLLAPDGRLLGVRYTTDKPSVHYIDENAGDLIRAINATFPDRLNRVVDMTADTKTMLVLSESASQPPVYLVAEYAGGSIRTQQLGSRAPGLFGHKLSEMKAIEFQARDETWIPGYLTLPAEAGQSPPPLIVMPHGGPYARDVWGFDPWVQFLAGRGYAVLQPNFRGSSGYGWQWLKAGFQNWGGLPYTDMVDATQWAVERGYADPARICVVGASFGGYLAMLAATDSSKLFRCAASIAGVSSLLELSWVLPRRVADRSIGTDLAKLKATSPRSRAKDMNMPLLMIHGKLDYTVDADQTRKMALALQRSGKKFETVYIDDADHYFQKDTHVRQLLGELGKFLDAQLKPGQPR